MADPRRLRRSVLACPGSNPAMIAKAARAGADVAFVDLEDAVAPELKVEARAHATHGLVAEAWGRSARAVRVNAPSSPWCLDDVVEVVRGAGHVLDVVIVPKVRSVRDVWFVDDLLGQLESSIGLPPGGIGLEVLIEEAEALQAVGEIARSSSRLEAITLGVGDLAASLGMRLGHVGVDPAGVWTTARHQLIVAARATGIEPIDGPFADFRDPDGLRASAESFALVGGGGKWCIHPAQIAVVDAVFSPTAAEVAEAEAVVAAVAGAAAEGRGAAQVGGVMVDAATARLFEARLERARRCRGDQTGDS